MVLRNATVTSVSLGLAATIKTKPWVFIISFQNKMEQMMEKKKRL